jgi:hypothetical protein
VKKFTKALHKSCKERRKLWCRSSKAMINSQFPKKHWTSDGMGAHFFYLSNNYHPFFHLPSGRNAATK